VQVMGLNSFEQAVLDKLLAGSQEVLATLRRQASTARVVKREHTVVGFFCWFEVAPDGPLVESLHDFTIDDVSAEMSELAHGAGFVLFIRGGRLDNLEGFTYGEPWPESTTDVVLRYSQEPRGDFV